MLDVGANKDQAVNTTDAKRRQLPIVVLEGKVMQFVFSPVLGRLSETVLLIHPDESDAVIEELRKMGHTPRVVR